MGGVGLKRGDVFAGYTVVDRIGGGGMGAVYLVRHPKLQKLFALKVINDAFSDDPQFVARFEREMVIVSTLRHPNIVSTSDAGTFAGRTWFTMTYVEGKDAAKTLDEQRHGLSADRVVAITDALADALDYAHRHQVLHRDVKPNNVLIDQDDHVFLTDFGIAKAAGDGHPSLTYQQPYSVDYASPEQISNAVVDARSDVYSLAATCYTLLTARVPYPADSVAAKINGHLNLPPPRPGDTRPDLPPAVNDVIATAMDKQPTRRYAACAEFAAALRTGLAGASPTVTEHDPPRPPAPVAPVPPRPRPRRWIAGAVVAAVLAAGIAGWILIRGTTTTIDPTGSASSQTDGSATSGSERAVAGPSGAAVDPVTATTGTAGSWSDDPGPAVVPLANLLDPPPPTRSGTSGGQPVAGTAAIELGPRTCPGGERKYSVDVGAGLTRITGTFLMSDRADPGTRTTVTVTADAVAVAQEVVAPRAGVTIDLDVTGVRDLTIDLATAGSGDCDSGSYLVFLTNAQAFR